MSVKHIRMKDWKAECPSCGNIEVSEQSGMACRNCKSPAIMTYGVPRNSNGSAGRWESPEARRSWRQLQCSKGCGWSINSMICSKCNATIQGDFFKGSTKWCFVATSAFNNIDHNTVVSLREWRDQSLSNSKVGQLLINYYYIHGESFAKRLDKHPNLKPMVRFILNNMVKILKIK